MSAFLTRLVERTLGRTASVQPLLASRYASGGSIPGAGPLFAEEGPATVAPSDLLQPDPFIPNPPSPTTAVPAIEPHDDHPPARPAGSGGPRAAKPDAAPPPARTPMPERGAPVAPRQPAARPIPLPPLEAAGSAAPPAPEVDPDRASERLGPSAASPPPQADRPVRRTPLRSVHPVHTPSPQPRTESDSNLVATPDGSMPRVGPPAPARPQERLLDAEPTTPRGGTVPAAAPGEQQTRLRPESRHAVDMDPLRGERRAARAGPVKHESERRPVRPVSPAPEPERSPAPSVGAPTVRITIGRIEVRAVVPPATPARKAPPTGPRLSLDEYPRTRNAGHP